MVCPLLQPHYKVEGLQIQFGDIFTSQCPCTVRAYSDEHSIIHIHSGFIAKTGDPIEFP